MEDIGKGKGKYYTVNVPLKQGVGGGLFLDLFERVLDGVVDAYEPDCIVLQCGCDGIGGDPLGGWNLDILTIGKCVKKVVDLKLPLILLGGGGYVPTNVARAWAYCTLIALGIEPPLEIPEHEHWPLYQPGFDLLLPQFNVKDCNLENNYISNLLGQLTKNIEQLKFRTKSINK